MNLSQQLKAEIVVKLKEASGVEVSAELISVPPKPEMGDLAVPVFQLAKQAGKNPVDLARELAEKIQSPLFSKVSAFGPYVNFYIETKKISEDLLGSILKEKNKYGAGSQAKAQKIMVEYFSPNTNKPMTVGHLRNLVLGATVSRLLKIQGNKVIGACLYNDRGIAIMKSLVAYDLFGKGQTPARAKMKSDQFVGHYYVMFGQKAEQDPNLELKAKKYLVKWEAGDKRIRALWKKMNGWVYKGYVQTLKALGEGKFDKIFYESDIYQESKDLVMANVGKGVIIKGAEGEITTDLSTFNLPNKILLRSDGTSLYITSDLVLADKKEKLGIDKSIYVIADEQNLQMQQLFAILESLGSPKDKFFHLSYGMMRLPEGRIKSREGFGKALADELISNLESLALVEIKTRNRNLSVAKQKKIANQIMNAALKFYILNIDPSKTMIFNPDEAVSFNGKTGPYLQYTAVRMNSVLKGQKVSKIIHADLLTEEIEKQLISKLKDYPEAIDEAAKKYSPAILTHYLYSLAQVANTFYHDQPILKAEKNLKNARLALIKAVNIVLANGLTLCGIEIPEKM